MRKFLLVAALSAILAGGAAAATPTQATPLPQASTCSGVWVVVDFGSLGGTSTKCSTSYGTGLAALKSAGFSPTVSDGFVYKISGKPSKPDTNKAYWSYWHATAKDDGSYSDWSYSNLGADSYHPTKGNAEGWRYQSLDGGKVPPGIAPPATDTSTPTPTPKPTKTATHKPTATASATKKPTATASATKTQTASASASATSTSATPSASPSAVVTPTPTLVATPLATNEATEVAQDAVSASPEATPAESSGTPVGAIVAGSAVLVAAAGLGGWWLLKGRKP